MRPAAFSRSRSHRPSHPHPHRIPCDVDVEALDAQLSTARAEQEQLLAYVEQASGFGFIGVETLRGGVSG